MKAIHINPFLNATLNLFEHMLNSKPNVGNKALITNIYSHRWDVSGVIGVTGAAEGVIALRMTQNLVERLMIKTGIKCKDEEELKQVTTSMVGEMANVIAGNALGEINQYNLNITVPIVVQGQNHSISWPAKNPIISIPFMCTQGTFEVNVSLKENILL